MTTTLMCRLAITVGVAAAGAIAQQPAPPPPQPPPAAAPPAQPAPAPPAQPAPPPPTVPGGLNLNNASLLEVINLLAQDLHINYILDSSIRGGSVTINTYGAVRDVDLRPLLETILRMNGLAMVQVGNIYRIIPQANVARQPVSPIAESDPSKIPEDERLVLNLVFLRYVTSGEMAKILLPFAGDGAQLTNYDPANLLIILDNSRNMRRTLELIALFDSDTFAGQRVRSYEIRNGRPTDIAKELDDIFKAYALSGDKGAAVRFLALDRVNSLLAVAPNPGAFTEVEKWIQKLDVPPRLTAGAIDNYVYKLRYARAEIIGTVVNQLYGGSSAGFASLFGSPYGIPGNSTYPATAYPGGGATGSSGGYGLGSPYGQAPGAYGNPYGNPNIGYQGGTGAAPYSAAAAPASQAPPTTSQAVGVAPAGGAAPASTPRDQTGTTLTPSFSGSGQGYGPRIIANQFDNTLLVQGTPQQWEQIKHLLEQLDVPPRQVLIDAKIYEVDLTGDFALGVETFLQKRGVANAAVPSRQLLGSSTPTSGIGSAPGISLTAGLLVGQSRELLSLLQASESTTKAKVLSAPSVVATDSIPASITVGSSVPTLSSVAASGFQQNGTTLFANNIQNTSTGIGLNILARVNPSGVVTMVINQNVTAPIPTTTSNIDSPSFSQRNVSTQVTVEDGDTVAIGGIITDNTTNTSAGIPVLHRIPYLGAAFGSKTTHKDRTELIIFLTPRVVYDTTQMTDATDELKQKVRGLQKLIKDE
jgi:general secretion pathway protein D